MKKTWFLFSVALLSVGLAGCGSHHSSAASSSSVKTSVQHTSRHKTHRAHHSSASAKASSQEDSSASQSGSTSASANTNQQHVINTADDAARLVAHAMAADDDLYHATPTAGGFAVTRSDTNQHAIVHYDGSVTWDDGTTQPYSEVSATEDNERVNNTYAPDN